jgi:hypothetical protein
MCDLLARIGPVKVLVPFRIAIEIRDPLNWGPGSIVWNRSGGKMIFFLVHSLWLQVVFSQQDTLAYRLGLIAGSVIMCLIVFVVIRKIFRE